MASIAEQKRKLMKEKADLLKLRKEVTGLKIEKAGVMKLRKEIKQLRQSPEVEKYRKLTKEARKKIGKGLGKFFTRAYEVAERATRPEPKKPVRRTKKKATKRKRR